MSFHRRMGRKYHKYEAFDWALPNAWDLLAGVIVLLVLTALAWSTSHMLGHFSVGQHLPIHLEARYLPYYALRTVVRMLIALACSLLFTFTIATWAAKSRHAERIIIPLIDILQSVPVLGFLSITVVGFIVLFKGSMLGPECAAIFAIFTAQVWNMTLSFYQSLITVPKELKEASHVFQLSAWQRFWRLEVPFAMPSLLWNTMMSMSGSWVFLVASEAFTVANHKITLPGLGSYIALAIERANTHAIWLVMMAMFAVILLYDQLIFRPLMAWSEKVNMHQSSLETEPSSLVLDLFQRTRLFQYLGRWFSKVGEIIVNGRWVQKKRVTLKVEQHYYWRLLAMVSLYIALGSALCVGLYRLYGFLAVALTWHDAWHVVFLGAVTAVRVFSVIVVSSIIWVPIGVWVGRSSKLAAYVQPVAQFLAAFPANLLFPVVTMAIIHYHLNVNIWTSPLMILGTQWYILFNVIAGVIALPNQLFDVTDTLCVRGWLRWKRLILPGIFPYFITGAITAAGGAWNISMIAEAVEWGKHHMYATGIGSYLTEMSQQGNFRHLVYAVIVMSVYVVLFNRIVWRPLYRLANQRFQLN